MLSRRRDRADRCERRQHQCHEIHGALEVPDMREPGVERHDQKKGKEHLYARDDHAQLAGQLLQIAIQSFKARLPARVCPELCVFGVI